MHALRCSIIVLHACMQQCTIKHSLSLVHHVAGCCRFLDVSFNRLKALPAGMSSLTGLAVLNLAYNPLGCFPEVLCSLTSLRELNMDQTGAPAWR